MQFAKLCLVLESHFDMCSDRHSRVDRIYIALQTSMQTGEAISDMGESVCACAVSFLVRLDVRQFCLYGSFSINGLYSVHGVGNSAKMPSEKNVEEDCCSNSLNLSIWVHNF